MAKTCRYFGITAPISIGGRPFSSSQPIPLHIVEKVLYFRAKYQLGPIRWYLARYHSTAGVSASPLASALTARGLPFIVLSGYSSEQLQGAFPGALFIQKPCRPTQLIQALNTIVPKQ